MLAWLTGNEQFEQVVWAKPVSSALVIVIAAAIAAWTGYVYRQRWGLRTGLWLGLLAARFVVLALIVAVLMEPRAVVVETHDRELALPVLLDVSQSMSMKDQRKHPEQLVEAAVALGMLPLEATGDAGRDAMTLDAKQRQTIASSTRLDLAVGLVSQSGRSVFESLGETLNVSYHAFGYRPRLVSAEAGLTAEAASAMTATEPQTSIAESLEAVAKSGDAPPAGIVLISDGIDNVLSRRSESVLQDLGARGIPVYTVPIGLAEPDDLSIRNVVMQDVAFSGDRVPVRVHVQSKGYEKRTSQLTVKLSGRRVSQRTIRLEGGLQFEDIDFHVDLYEKGAAQVDVSLSAFDDEVSVENNRAERSIRVVNEKVNVLYIEGNARWEFRYLRAILKRDPRINATFIASMVGPEMARNSGEHLERFPDTREEVFAYDLVILGDVDAEFFKPEELTLLEELVRDRGGSLVVLCGPMHTPAGYVGTPVQTMLPVRFDTEGAWQRVSESVYPTLTAEGRTSMVMTLENNVEENDLIWSRVSPLDHLPPLLDPKPGATVLATLSDGGAMTENYPLFAWHRYGTGKCMSIATDRLWRLRFKTGDRYHWRLWSQCIQFMTLSRLMGEHKRIRLETGRSAYPVGEQARLYAHVLDDNFEPIIQPRFDVMVTGMDELAIEHRISLRPDQSRPGLYEGYFSPPAPGRYRVESSEEDRRVSNSTEFQVVQVKQELADTNVRIEYLQRIADLTGGARLSAQQLPELATLVDTEAARVTVRSQRPLWDNAWVAFILIALLGGEWLLRRMHDLP